MNGWTATPSIGRRHSGGILEAGCFYVRYEESLDQHEIGGYKAVCHQVALDLAFDLNAN